MEFFNNIVLWFEQQINDIKVMGETFEYIMDSIPLFLSWLPSELYYIVMIGICVAIGYQVFGR